MIYCLQILYSIHKMTSKAGGAWMSCEDDVTERIMLHICPTTRKYPFTCDSLELFYGFFVLERKRHRFQMGS